MVDRGHSIESDKELPADLHVQVKAMLEDGKTPAQIARAFGSLSNKAKAEVANAIASVDVENAISSKDGSNVIEEQKEISEKNIELETVERNLEIYGTEKPLEPIDTKSREKAVEGIKEQIGKGETLDLKIIGKQNNPDEKRTFNPMLNTGEGLGVGGNKEDTLIASAQASNKGKAVETIKTAGQGVVADISDEEVNALGGAFLGKERRAELNNDLTTLTQFANIEADLEKNKVLEPTKEAGNRTAQAGAESKRITIGEKGKPKAPTEGRKPEATKELG